MLLSAEAIRLGKFNRPRNIRGSRTAVVCQLYRLVSHLFATRRHTGQRGLGLGHEPAHNLAYGQNFIDASGGLTGPEYALMLTACLGRRDDLTPQAVSVAPRLFALAAPFFQESCRERARNRWETLCARNGADVVQNINLAGVL